MSGEGIGTGGKKGMPRSLGLVFQTIRFEQKKNQDEMAMLLYDLDSPFTKELSKKHPSELKKPRGKLGNWEKGDSGLNFTYQHRYALLSKTRTGTLHTTSGFFCHFRRALISELVQRGDKDFSEDHKKIVKDDELDAIIKMAEQHKALCDFAIEQAKSAKEKDTYLIDKLGDLPYKKDKSSGRVKQGTPTKKEPHLKFIIEFLNAYRSNSSDNVDCS